jgi:hypothetical protein
MLCNLWACNPVPLTAGTSAMPPRGACKGVDSICTNGLPKTPMALHGPSNLHGQHLLANAKMRHDLRIFFSDRRAGRRNPKPLHGYRRWACWVRELI